MRRFSISNIVLIPEFCFGGFGRFVNLIVWRVSDGFSLLRAVRTTTEMELVKNNRLVTFVVICHISAKIFFRRLIFLSSQNPHGLSVQSFATNRILCNANRCFFTPAWRSLNVLQILPFFWIHFWISLWPYFFFTNSLAQANLRTHIVFFGGRGHYWGKKANRAHMI